MANDTEGAETCSEADLGGGLGLAVFGEAVSRVLIHTECRRFDPRGDKDLAFGHVRIGKAGLLGIAGGMQRDLNDTDKSEESGKQNPYNKNYLLFGGGLAGRGRGGRCLSTSRITRKHLLLCHKLGTAGLHRFLESTCAAATRSPSVSPVASRRMISTQLIRKKKMVRTKRRLFEMGSRVFLSTT